MPRMNILSPAEQDGFDTPPVFNSVERKKFFDFPSALQGKAKGFRTPLNRLGFLLACGYFKAAKKFFKPQDYHQRDIEYVASRVGLSPDNFDPAFYAPATVFRHQQSIADYYGYRPFDQNAVSFIAGEITDMVSSQLKPKLIFWRCVDVMIREHIQLPNVHQLSELILTALNQRKKDLATVINKELRPEAQALLDGLFEQEGENAYARYRLTLLKNFPSPPNPLKSRNAQTIFPISQSFMKA